jgi:hypothetical protein
MPDPTRPLRKHGFPTSGLSIRRIPPPDASPRCGSSNLASGLDSTLPGCATAICSSAVSSPIPMMAAERTPRSRVHHRIQLVFADRAHLSEFLACCGVQERKRLLPEGASHFRSCRLQAGLRVRAGARLPTIIVTFDSLVQTVENSAASPRRSK